MTLDEFDELDDEARLMRDLPDILGGEPKTLDEFGEQTMRMLGYITWLIDQDHDYTKAAQKTLGLQLSIHEMQTQMPWLQENQTLEKAKKIIELMLLPELNAKLRR